MRSAVPSFRRWIGMSASLVLAVGVGAATGPGVVLAQPLPQPWGAPPPPQWGPNNPGPFYNSGFPRQQMMGSRCASQFGLCFMPGAGPVGGPCYCQTPYGPVGGQIVP